MNIMIEDIKEFKKNAVKILKKNSQYATAKATEEAFDTLIWLKETIEKFNNTIELVDKHKNIEVWDMEELKEKDFYNN